MFRIKGILLLGVFISTTATAAVSDFEDLVLNTSYVVGQSFTSNGNSFDVVSFQSAESNIWVSANGGANGSGQELFMGNSIGVNFLLAADAQEISLRYGEFCCDSGIEVNGVLSTPVGGLVSLDGMTIGGVLFEVTSSGAANDQGVLTATGSINSFIIRGTEFFLDDVSVVVPEPSGVALLGSALMMLMGWRLGSDDKITTQKYCFLACVG